jgi:hypothetical protein
MATNKARFVYVTYIRAQPEQVFTALTDDELEAGSPMAKGITWGWPRVLASLKSLLETGAPLPTWTKKHC